MGTYPIQFPDGTPAVELHAKMPLPFKTPDGSPYTLVVNLDSIMGYGIENWISDNKTTSKTLNHQFYAGYNPSVQFDTYDLVGSVLWPSLEIKGVLIEAAQVTRDSIQFGVGTVRKTEAQRAEWLAEMEWWIKQAEVYATNDHWPMNRRNCWLCEFKGICSKDPGQRQRYLEADFDKQRWNTLEER